MFGERKSEEDETRGWEERSHGGRGFRDCRARQPARKRVMSASSVISPAMPREDLSRKEGLAHLDPCSPEVVAQLSAHMPWPTTSRSIRMEQAFLCYGHRSQQLRTARTNFFPDFRRPRRQITLAHDFSNLPTTVHPFTERTDIHFFGTS
jgi:hypothetical protein